MSDLETQAIDLAGAEIRQCPWCNSYDTLFVHRGYTGPTDEINQYFSCNACKKVTYELVSKTAREMRVGRFRAGGTFRDPENQTRYQVSRVLKVGINEYLVYLRPLLPGSEALVHR
jgi:transposase-like protein